MILLFILGVSVLQYVLYIFNAKRRTKIPEFIIAVLFLIGHFFVFPHWFFPESRPDGVNCGMPTLGIVLAFWVFGTSGVISIHILGLRKTRKIKKNNGHL